MTFSFLDDEWILAFLRGSKFSLERTKEKLDFFYTVRTMLPEFFTNRDPYLPEIQEILKLGFVYMIFESFYKYYVIENALLNILQTVAHNTNQVFINNI